MSIPIFPGFRLRRDDVVLVRMRVLNPDVGGTVLIEPDSDPSETAFSIRAEWVQTVLSRRWLQGDQVVDSHGHRSTVITQHGDAVFAMGDDKVYHIAASTDFRTPDEESIR